MMWGHGFHLRDGHLGARFSFRQSSSIMKAKFIALALRPILFVWVCALTLISIAGRAHGQTDFAGRLDASFVPPPDIQVQLYVGRESFVTLQPSGKVILGAEFEGEGHLVVRLNTDGARDLSFAGGSPVAFPYLTGITVQPDGAILLSGPTLSRLLPDGSPDGSFDAGLDGVPNWWFYTQTRVALQTDGKILVSGGFSSVHGNAVARLARLLPNGARDGTFMAASADLPESIMALRMQGDGKILVAGDTYIPATNSMEFTFIRLLPNGARDVTFTPDLERGVSAIAMQPDGKIVVAGYDWNEFYRHHGYIDRLNADGSDDPTFAGGESFPIQGWNTEGVHSLLVQPDGKIVACGSFILGEATSGGLYGCLVRLNADGTQDSGFAEFQVVAGDDITSVTSMARQADGHLVIAGDFEMVAGVPRSGAARILSDATGVQGFVSIAAASFTLQEDGSSLNVTIQREGPNLGPVTLEYGIQNYSGYSPFFQGIYTGEATEDFTAVTATVAFANGETSKTFSVPLLNDTLVEQTESFDIVLAGGNAPFAYGDRPRAVLHVFDDDSVGLTGSLNTSFTGQLTGTVAALLTQADGKLLVGGTFSALNGVSRTNLLRLNLDGTLDMAFASNVPDVTALALQPDGKIIVAGTSIRRLETNGTLDTDFQPFDAINAVRALAVQSDGRILAGNSNGLLRLLHNGFLDPSFQAFQGIAASARVSSVRAIALRPDGRIFVGGENASMELPALNRLNPDGSGDASFVSPNFGLGYYGFELGILSLAFQPDGKLLVGGGFTLVTGNSTRSGILRLNLDDTIDTGFNPIMYSNAATAAIIPQTDGRILVLEYFGYNAAEGTQVKRLHADGWLDHSLLSSAIAVGGIQSIAEQPGNTIWIGGTFSSFNGYAQPAIARLHGDDQIGPGRFAFVPGYVSGKENAGSVTLKVRRYWGTQGAVDMHYETSDVTAQGGVHYVTTSGTLSFASGEVEKTISVPLIDNSIPELNRYFWVNLSQPTGGALLGEYPTSSVLILENDAGILVHRAEIVDGRVYAREHFSVRENSGSVLVWLVYVGEPLAGPITLNYTTHDGTARAGQDYTPVTWHTYFGGPYSLTQDLTVPLLADSTPEAPETFTISLSTDAPGVQLTQSEITVTIVDAAPPPGFRLFVHPAGPTSSDRFRLLLQAPTGTEFDIEASTNLIDWTVLKTFPAQTTLDPLEFEDIDPATMPMRFYRLISH